MIATEPNPVVRYVPRGACLDAIEARVDEVLISGPAGTGKSIACLHKLLIIAYKKPGVRLGIIRRTRASLAQSALVTFENKVLPPGNQFSGKVDRRNRSSYKFQNGSEIVVGGIDKPERIMSTDFDLFYIQEATELTEEHWEMLTTRLRFGPLPYQQMIADCNPQAPTHWLKRRCDRGACLMLNSRHEENPALWSETKQQWTPAGIKYLAKLDRLTGARLQRLRYGRWVQAEGVVYDNYTQDHLIDPFPIPQSWQRIMAIDFGYNNPFVCLWIALSPDRIAYVYRQIYMSRRICEDHARQIVALSRDEYIVASIADHDAEDRATLNRHGVPTIPADKKSIRTGIDVVTNALAIQPNGKARLYIFRDSLVEVDRDLEDAKLPYCLEQEFDCYVWKTKKPDKNSDEVPVDANNHGMDALRYGMMYLNRDRIGASVTISRSTEERSSAGFRDW